MESFSYNTDTAVISDISSVISAGLKVEMTELHSREIQQVMTFREMKYGTWKKSLFFFFWTNSYFSEWTY